MKQHLPDRLVSLRASASQQVLLHARTRVNGAVASDRTVRMTLEVAMAACNKLWDLGYHLPDIRGLETRHVQALVRSWYEEGRKPKTMENNLSRLRLLCGWIGKPLLVPKRNGVQAFLPDVPAEALKVRTVAAKSKSWSENGVDVVAVIERAHAIDRRLGAMLYLCVAFGLRRQEQVMIQPHRADAGTFLKIRDNIAKSGRDRDVPIEHPFQRAALDRAKQVARRGQALGWPGGTLEQNLARYSYLLRERLHISRKESHCVAHGLRAEYAENVMMLAGLIPPVLGGARDQMSLDERRAIQGQLSENMGHSPERPEITHPYTGSFRVRPVVEPAAENVMWHRGHAMNMTVDAANHRLLGVLANVREHVQFAAPTLDQLREAFEHAVDEKLAAPQRADGLDGEGRLAA